MSNLKKRLNKTADVNVSIVQKKLLDLIEEVVAEKERETGYEEEMSSVLEQIDAYMDTEFNMDVYTIATAICSAVKNWGNETEKDYE